MTTSQQALLVDGLTVGFDAGAPPVIDGLGFSVARRETLAIVGESGSGKTLTGRALMGILPRGARLLGGRALYRPGDGGPEVDLLALRRSALRRLCGGRIAMVFQEPMSALSPLHTVGAQVAEVLALHTDLPAAAIHARCLATFAEVGFPDPERAWRA